MAVGVCWRALEDREALRDCGVEKPGGGGGEALKCSNVGLCVYS